jgi:hypothetical protein
LRQLSDFDLCLSCFLFGADLSLSARHMEKESPLPLPPLLPPPADFVLDDDCRRNEEVLRRSQARSMRESEEKDKLT